jgi:hypothetical protein
VDTTSKKQPDDIAIPKDSKVTNPSVNKITNINLTQVNNGSTPNGNGLLGGLNRNSNSNGLYQNGSTFYPSTQVQFQPPPPLPQYGLYNKRSLTDLQNSFGQENFIKSKYNIPLITNYSHYQQNRDQWWNGYLLKSPIFWRSRSNFLTNTLLPPYFLMYVPPFLQIGYFDLIVSSLLDYYYLDLKEKVWRREFYISDQNASEEDFFQIIGLSSSSPYLETNNMVIDTFVANFQKKYPNKVVYDALNVKEFREQLDQYTVNK